MVAKPAKFPAAACPVPDTEPPRREFQKAKVERAPARGWKGGRAGRGPRRKDEWAALSGRAD